MLCRATAVAIAALVLALLVSPASAQAPVGVEAPNPAPATAIDFGLSPEQIERILREAEQNPELDEETRKAVGDACRAALVDLQLAADFYARGEAFAHDAGGVAARVQEVKQQLEEHKTKEPTIAADATLTDLEQAVSKAELLLTTRKTTQTKAEGAPQARAQRRKEIRTRLATIQERVVGIAAQQEAPPTTQVAALATAKSVELKARRIALEQEAPYLEAELTKYDAEDAADLVRLQSDLATRQTAYTERRLQRLKEELKTAREKAAEDSVRKARIEAIVAVPVLRLHAERNQQLAETGQAIAQKLTSAEQDLKSAKVAHDQLSRQFKLTHTKVDTVGLTSSVGAMLRKQRASLPDVRERRAAVAGRRAIIDETQYQLFEYDDERDELGDIDAMIETILAEAPPRDEQAAAFLEDSARELLDRKREYLDALNRTYGQYFDTLIELDTTDQQVISLAERYTKFIDERVLWIRSGKVLTQDFGYDPSDSWMLSYKKWSEVGARFVADTRTNPWLYGLFACLFGVLLVRGGRLRRQLIEAGDTAARANCRTFEPTMRAAALTVLISLAWPGMVAFAAWRLQASGGEEGFVKAVSHGLYSLCLLWWPLELFRQTCRPRGLAESHFDWPASTTQSFRQRLRWFTLLGLPFAFLTATLFASDVTHGRDTIERLCFIAGIGLLSVLVFRVLRPSDVLREHIAYNPGGWVDRLKHVWAWLGAAIPAALLGLAFAGYYYTAQVLSWRLFATCCFLVALVLLRDSLLRLLLLRRRNLSMEQAKQRAAAAAAATEGDANSVAGIVAATPQSDLSAHNQQTRRLVTTGFFATSVVGLWLIWVQVLPALGMLDKYPLWSTSPAVAQVASAAPSPSPTPMPTGPTSVDTYAHEAPGKTTVTLSDLGLALLVTFVTFVLFRNGPGLLEMSLLQKLPLDASVRYAITTLASYAIVMIGAVTACSTIGLRWSQIQWLATALTFGLAFGLQEMFANFVAGLIILLERPIRVGDVVTVDDITGVVSRIRIRATSITNWDRKEYVVPNKEFITGRLLNWTLSDKVNRVVVNVGVAYGTDTDRARDLLLAAANEHPLILKDPPAVATFEGFGDNSLDFVLRSYLPTLDNRLDVIHALHTSINKAFKAEGIEIAFPQRDLHIRTAPEVLATALGREQAQRDHSAASPDAEAVDRSDAA